MVGVVCGLRFLRGKVEEFLKKKTRKEGRKKETKEERKKKEKEKNRWHSLKKRRDRTWLPTSLIISRGERYCMRLFDKSDPAVQCKRFMRRVHPVARTAHPGNLW